MEHKWIVDWPLDKKPTAVSPAPALNQEPKGIFIGKLNPELVNLNNLRAAFEGFGEIEWMTLKNKNTLTMTTNSPITPAPVRLKPAYAFITFKLRPSASKAIEAMNGSIFLERVISVSFCDKRSNQGRSPSGQQQQQSFLISFESPLHGDGLYTSKRMSIDSSSSSLSTPHRPGENSAS